MWGCARAPQEGPPTFEELTRPFPAVEWIDAADAAGLGDDAWLVLTAMLQVMDNSGSVGVAELLDAVEADGGNVLTAIDGVHELAANHLILDLGTRLVAVLPQITVNPTPKEA
jgi:hypothetical protein